jgi:putative FmdB family regulatory protein
MPTYDYKCNECEDVFEVKHSVHDNVESCPKCGGKVRRIFHPVGIIFKGPGFYSTDYKSGSSKVPGNGGEKLSPDKVGGEMEKIKDEVSGDGAKEKKKPENSEIASS